MAALTGVSAVSLIAGVGTASAAGVGASAAPAAVDHPPTSGDDWSCDEGGWHWGSAPLAPDNQKYNPSTPYTKTQLHQWHILAEDTYSEAVTTHRGTYIYVEDMKSGQKCPSPRNTDPTGKQGTVTTSDNGFLDNRNTSVRTCIVDPGAKTKCGHWYREDSGGHRQLDFRGLEKLDYALDPGATASYDDHANPGGNSPVDGYGIRFGPKEWASLHVSPGGAGKAYGSVVTSNKNVRVRIDSDKYGKGDWAKPGEKFGGLRQGTTGVLYNNDDRLRVVVREPNGDVHYGRWHPGDGV